MTISHNLVHASMTQTQTSIYLDYMATTPVDSTVIAAMRTCLGTEADFGNASSQTHRYGWRARQHIEAAAEQVAALIHADPKSLIWTSGATEANNLAILGAMDFYHRKGRHLVVVSTAHASILGPCQQLARQGVEITYLNPRPNGQISLTDLNAAIREDTVLVSVMWVNNETGVIQEIPEIRACTQEKGVLLHVDAVQAVGKLPIDVSQIPVDLMALSAHKVYGPKGVGALYVRRQPRVRLTPLLYGGDQQSRLRPGTLATHQVVGMGAAYALAEKQLTTDWERITALRQQLWQGIEPLGGLELNTDLAHSVPHCLNISVMGVDIEGLLSRLSEYAVSTTSACKTASFEPSHVLMAMGRSRAVALNALRISLGRQTTTEQVTAFIHTFTSQVKALRALSPAWSSQPAWTPQDEPESFLDQSADDDNKKSIHHFTLGHAENGVLIELHIELTDTVITSVTYHVLGNDTVIQGCEWLSNWLQGQSVSDLLVPSVEGVMADLSLVPTQSFIAYLLLDAIKQIHAKF